MKKVFLILVLNLTILIIGQNFALSQDPNDPGAPDTVWISRIQMSETVDSLLGWPKPFAIKCSVFTDEGLAGISIPISFYHSQNLDILVDTIFWSDWLINANPNLKEFRAQNDSVTEPILLTRGLLEALFGLLIVCPKAEVFCSRYISMGTL